MERQITLTIAEGSLCGKGFTLNERGRYVVGRGDDCDIKLSENPYLSGISRHHCVLAVEPPRLRIRDLGSRNGTYVNGESIGQRNGSEPIDEGDLDDFTDFELQDGDVVRVGTFTFQVHFDEGSTVHEPAYYFPVNLD